ncbi:MAG: hypothetical protein NDJ89_16500 [Oligoflexia bacterium]|nr:hypothetical protein [Oligoflexia bacterium]
MKLIRLMTWITLAMLTAAESHAAYYTDWRNHTQIQYRYIYNILDRSVEALNPEVAAEQAAARCAPEIQRLEEQGYRILMFRGNSIPNGQGWSGNCDVQVIDFNTQQRN